MAALGSTVIVACDDSKDEPPSEFFTGVDDCLAHEADTSVCGDSERKAREAHEASAPRYTDRTACEGALGQCYEVQRPDASGQMLSFFLPAMAGYAIARAMDGSVSTRPVYAGPAPACPPERRDCQQPSSRGSGGGSYFYSGNSYVGYGRGSGGETITRPAPGSFQTPRTITSAAPMGARATTSSFSVVRGGFGATASAHAGGGS